MYSAQYYDQLKCESIQHLNYHPRTMTSKYHHHKPIANYIIANSYRHCNSRYYIYRHSVLTPYNLPV